VEPRAETKGNAGWQSTRRTQSRISVSKALARIRQALAVWTRGAEWRRSHGCRIRESTLRNRRERFYQVQRLLAALAIMAAPRRLAIDGDQIRPVGPAFGHPGRKAGCERVRIDPVHDNPQPIGARNAVVELREPPQERFIVTTKKLCERLATQDTAGSQSPPSPQLSNSGHFSALNNKQIAHRTPQKMPASCYARV
jgi:hypothetical protein